MALPRKKKSSRSLHAGSFPHVITFNLIRYLQQSPAVKAEQTSTLNMKDRNGWDGKLRIDDPDNRRAILTNPEALEDPDYSDDDAPPVEEIDADEGASFLLDSCVLLVLIARSVIDLLEDESPDAEVRLTYCGVASFLRTRRWQELQVPEYTNNGCEGYRSDTFTNIQYRCAETRTIHQA